MTARTARRVCIALASTVSPGNRVEETIYAHELILPSDGGPPFTATQAFRSTATAVGRELMNRVSRKSPGGDVANPVLFKWRMTSQLERRGDYHWSQAAGDPAWQVRRAQWQWSDHRAGSLRRSIAQGVQDRRKLGCAARAAGAAQSVSPDRTPALRASPGGSIAITSGRPALKSVETAPPLEHDGGPDDGPDDDSYDNIPF